MGTCSRFPSLYVRSTSPLLKSLKPLKHFKHFSWFPPPLREMVLNARRNLQMGFFTPLYAIAAPLIGQHPLLTSMMDGVFYLALSPALLGLVIHLLWSALWGLIFGLLAHRLHLTDGGASIGGLIYGVLVMLVMFFFVLPVVGASYLLEVLGGWLFWVTIAHALFYGLPLGLWPMLQPQFFTDSSVAKS